MYDWGLVRRERQKRDRDGERRTRTRREARANLKRGTPLQVVIETSKFLNRECIENTLFPSLRVLHTVQFQFLFYFILKTPDCGTPPPA